MDTKIQDVFAAYTKAIDGNHHHALTYDYLLSHSLVNIVNTYGTFVTLLNNVRYKLVIHDVFSEICSPFPHICYQQGLNYTISIKASISFFIEEVLYNDNWKLLQTKIIDIAHIPLMTGSTNCISKLSPEEKEQIKQGEPFTGVFICRGKSRTVPMVKNIKNNIPIFKEKDKYVHCQVRSIHSDKMYRSTSTVEIRLNTNTITFDCKVPFQPIPIPLYIIVIALGSTLSLFEQLVYAYINARITDMEYFTYKISILRNIAEIHEQNDGILYISKMYGKSITSTGQNVLFNEFLPHLRDPTETSNMCPTTNNHKLLFLAHCISTIILIHCKKQTCTIRDMYIHSHITTAADHIGSLFRLLFIAHMRTCGKLLRRALMKMLSKNNVLLENDNISLDIQKVYGEPRLSARIMSAVSSGIWSKLRKGVSMSLNTNNTDSIEAQLRRVSSTLASTDGTHTGPRNIQQDQYGFICAASTPDGESTGLVYEIAITCSITPPVSIEDIHNISIVIDTLFLHETSIYKTTQWFKMTQQQDNSSIPTIQWYQFIGPNHIPTYMVADVQRCVDVLLQARRSGILPRHAFISVQHDRRIIRLEYSGGQMYRPLIIVKSLPLLSTISPGTTWEEYITKGIVEFVSPAEQSSICCIATLYTFSLETKKNSITHIELTEASFLGKMGATVPFATGQQGPRLAYFTAQKRQIITSEKSIFRGAPTTSQMYHTFRPLVESTVSTAQPLSNRIGRGTPVILAFMSLPDNQEDAIVVKKEALERGAFKSCTTRTYLSEITTVGNTNHEVFENPGSVVGTQNADYQYLTDTGIPKLRTKLPGNVVVIGKTKNMKQIPVQRRGKAVTNNKCDISTVSRHDEYGIVTRAEKYKLHNGTRVHVDITTPRPICVGDKFTSTYAQKGVVGAIWKSVDMPFSMQTGIVPDIIASPLSLTSRMTMSSLIEALTGKVVCLTGDRVLGIDKQQYSKGNFEHVTEMENLLVQYGFSSDGTEIFVDGRTGNLIKTRIFVGCIEMYRLVHMATKKIHARSIGPRDPLTRQPKDGRKFGGGLRIGEMESSALAAHGCSRVLQERFREHSDAFNVCICNTCGTIVDDVNTGIGYQFCHICYDSQSIQCVKMPFTFLILILELLSTGISVKFKTTLR
jgi:DNA-directed RNA polymerase subunit B